MSKQAKTVHVGFGNSIVIDKIIAIVNPDSNPTKRIISDARTNGKLVDVTEGRRTRAVLVMDDCYVALSALQPETIVARLDDCGGNDEQ